MIGKIDLTHRAPRLALAATALLLAVLFGSDPIFAQAGGVGSPTPGVGATSPFGMAPNSPIPPAGIPLGSTELASPGLSPLPPSAAATTGSGAPCSAQATPPSGLSGSSTIFDGAGMTMGMSLPRSASTTGMPTTGC